MYFPSRPSALGGCTSEARTIPSSFHHKIARSKPGYSILLEGQLPKADFPRFARIATIKLIVFFNILGQISLLS
jgi:hypothetical protein